MRFDEKNNQVWYEIVHKSVKVMVKHINYFFFSLKNLMLILYIICNIVPALRNNNYMHNKENI